MTRATGPPVPPRDDDHFSPSSGIQFRVDPGTRIGAGNILRRLSLQGLLRIFFFTLIPNLGSHSPASSKKTKTKVKHGTDKVAADIDAFHPGTMGPVFLHLRPPAIFPVRQ